jgi:putative IMPACT (imprinted ancient) family translation regulator
LKDEYFKNATHNSYAYRIKLENSSVLEWKNDDGETWAWMCILRELQRKNAVNIMIVVTRYFGWIKLQTDRFKNVIDACKIFFEKYEKNNCHSWLDQESLER